MRKQAKGKENKENKKKRTQGNPKWAKVNELRSGDFLLMIFTAALVIFGIIMVFSASYYYSISQDGTAYSYLRRQIMWVIAGFCAMVFGAAFDYRRYRKFAIPFLILGVILLALIFTPLGHTANNATRWLKVGPITFMPGEFAKLFVIIFTAWFLSEKPDRIKSVTRGILPLVGIAAVYGLLIVKQPNLSTAITVCGIIVSMMLVAGMKWRYVFGTAALGGAGILSILLFMKDTYWYQRMTSFVDPFQDPLGEGYQAVQSLLALGSGGLFGVGLGKSVQKNLYLPEPQNDFIFSILCEELGFVGAALTVVLFLLLFLRGMSIAVRARDKFGALLAVGFVVQVVLQAVLNIAVVTNTIPNTGISLPFFSSGGTSLMMLLGEMGIVLSVSRQADAR